MFRSVLSLLAPERCLACGVRAVMPWCPSCAALVRELPLGCPRCATPRGAAHACWPADAPISAMSAVYDYRGPVADAIVTAKVRGARAGWPVMASHLDASLERHSEVDVVTWVTTARARVRARGQDHARVLARRAALVLQVPCVRLLEATAAGDRDHYRAAVRLPSSNVLLVDDVVTTGATAWRAAAALQAAGAGTVSLAVLARAGTHPLGVIQQ